jgi:hypothetical protein
VATSTETVTGISSYDVYMHWRATTKEKRSDTQHESTAEKKKSRRKKKKK